MTCPSPSTRNRNESHPSLEHMLVGAGSTHRPKHSLRTHPFDSLHHAGRRVLTHSCLPSTCYPLSHRPDACTPSKAEPLLPHPARKGQVLFTAGLSDSTRSVQKPPTIRPTGGTGPGPPAPVPARSAISKPGTERSAPRFISPAGTGSCPPGSSWSAWPFKPNEVGTSSKHG